MCIIVVKRAGVDLPDLNTLKTCYHNNPDGAGIAWWNPGTKRFEFVKGLMSFEQFKTALKNVPVDKKDNAMLLHFRITSVGETSAPQCHPFPVGAKQDVNALSGAASIVLAHNGTMDLKLNPGTSDTQTFTENVIGTLYRHDRQFYVRNDARRLIETVLNSGRLVIAHHNTFELFGEFRQEDGVLYSNYSYYARYYIPVYTRSLWRTTGKEEYVGKDGKKYSYEVGLYDEPRTHPATLPQSAVWDSSEGAWWDSFEGRYLYPDEFDEFREKKPAKSTLSLSPYSRSDWTDDINGVSGFEY